MADVIYVLTNEAMPGLVKLGLTTDELQARVAQLNAATGVPLPFEVYFAAEVADAATLERKLHQLFAESRLNPRREFFRLDPEKAVLAISIGPFHEITPGQTGADPEEEAALNRIKARRPNLRLDKIGIGVGAELIFSRNEAVRAVVAEGNKVTLDGESLSLSSAALRVLQSMGYRTPAVSGSEYWMFEGELLDERRRRLEAEQFGERAPGVA